MGGENDGLLGQTKSYLISMTTINLYQAKTQLSRLVATVEKEGGRIVLCRNGSPEADLVLHTPPRIQSFRA